jgi:hypothetical protein
MVKGEGVFKRRIILEGRRWKKILGALPGLVLNSYLKGKGGS